MPSSSLPHPGASFTKFVQERLLLPHHDFSLYMVHAEDSGTAITNPVTVLASQPAACVAFAVYLIRQLQ
ncbi:MAG: hypothetical protein HY295_07370 [Thaumarchaeota archaeon]|nr:hypothetical protein [Nitrososphaerota archaeon]